MIVVTGGAGFIGGNLVAWATRTGRSVTVVDDADLGRVADVLAPVLDHGATITQVGQAEYLARLVADPVGALAGVDAVLHQGACSSTTETDEAFLTANNLDWSIAVFEACQAARVPLVYASSASVYGDGTSFTEDLGQERPLNGYARSKAAFDRYVAARLDQLTAQVVGLRYFNVYGPGEAHKGPMASLVLQLADQIDASGQARLFGAGEGAGPGEHRRDFVFVDDVVAVVAWFLDHPDRSGIVNCGTGRCRMFRDLADAVIHSMGRGELVYIPFPESLRGRYQSHTEADLTALRALGCDHRFASLEDGVASYVRSMGRAAGGATAGGGSAAGAADVTAP